MVIGIREIIASISIVALSGCAGALSIGESDYGCRGMEYGVRCMSASDVYAATEDTDRVKPTSTISGEDLTGESGFEEDYDYSDSDYTDSDYTQRIRKTKVVRKTYQPAEILPAVIKAKPLRTQAEVLRIWVAPWEDNSGDFNATGYVFTEIEERRWSVGLQQFRNRSLKSPLTKN